MKATVGLAMNFAAVTAITMTLTSNLIALSFGSETSKVIPRLNTNATTDNGTADNHFADFRAVGMLRARLVEE